MNSESRILGLSSSHNVHQPIRSKKMAEIGQIVFQYLVRFTDWEIDFRQKRETSNTSKNLTLCPLKLLISSSYLFIVRWYLILYRNVFFVSLWQTCVTNMEMSHLARTHVCSGNLICWPSLLFCLRPCSATSQEDHCLQVEKLTKNGNKKLI